MDPKCLDSGKKPKADDSIMMFHINILKNQKRRKILTEACFISSLPLLFFLGKLLHFSCNWFFCCGGGGVDDEGKQTEIAKEK